MSTLRRTRRFLIGAVAIAGALVSVPASAQTSADVQLALTGTAATTITYGQFKKFSFKVTNAGPSVATGLKISSLTVPSEFTYEIAGCTPVDADVGPVPCVIDDGTIIDEPDMVHPAYQKAFSITVTLPSKNADDEWIYPATCTAGDTFDDIVVTVAADTSDPTPANNTVTVPGLETSPFWDLEIALTAPTSASIGDTIEVGATVTNHGPCDATEVSVNDWWFGATSQTLGFISAEGDCDADTFGGDGCFWDVVEAGTTKTWTIQYEVLDLPKGLMQTGDPVYMDVVSDGAPYFGVADSRAAAGKYPELDRSNDSFQTQTLVSKSQSGCSTGDFGGALGLLLVAVPFLRRRRKS
jgi:MYXO-CTERM domain-containing protein